VGTDAPRAFCHLKGKIGRSVLAVTRITLRTLKAVRIPALVLLLALVLVAVVGTAAPMPAFAVGTVAPLDAWPATPQMTGTTGNPTNVDFAISDGINRLLVMLVCGYDSGGSSGQTFTATYGAKTLTQAVLQNNNRRQTWIGYLKETDIASRTDNAVTVTVTGTHTQVRVYIASYSGVDQTTPIAAASGVYINNSNDQPIGGPLTVNAGGYGIYGWSGTSGRIRNSDTETYDEHSNVNNTGGGAFNYGVASKAFATTTTTNPSVTWSGNNRVSVSFVTLNPDSTYPLPTTTGISPASKTVGDAGFTLTVNGSNFINGASVVRLDGADRATTFVTSTQLTATIPASDLTATGTRSITVFTPAPGGGTSNAQTLMVNKATPTITWANPADIVYGTTLNSTQLCAAASVPGTFVYSPDVGALLLAGDSQTLHVDFTPTDTAIYYNASADATINVNKASLTITASSLNKTYGDATIFTGAEFTSNGLVNGDTVTSVTLTSTGAAADAAVGGSPYSVVPSAALGTGLSNYNITYVNGALTVNKASVGLSLSSSASTSDKGHSVTFTATVTGTGATGTVTFQDGETILGSSTLSDGTATYTISTLSIGTHSITAVYNGDANFAGSTSSAIDLTVNKASVALSLSSSLGTSTEGRLVTFAATVTDTGATGTVTFQDGETILGSSTLVDGTATYTITTLSAGSHSITAVYSGDANFAGSTSSTVDLTIDLPMKAAAGFNWWAVIGGLIATDVLLGLLLLLLILRRRRKNPSGTNALSGATEVAVGAAGKNHGSADPDLANPATLASLAAGDAVDKDMALPTAEEVGTYSIQLERELEKSLRKVEKSIDAAIQAISRTVETRDAYVAGHQKRVAQLACTIAKEMGLTAWQIDGIRVAGLLHDIGKITVPTEILSKPGRLSAIEVTMIKDHPKVAFDILKNVEFDWPIARIVVQHHERMDGSGYPYGIPGKDMLLEARILAVADVMEAMSSDRPYRPALGIEKALAELKRGDGTLYDPEVVRACEKVINERGFKVELSSSHT
jgi:putative nucleotidyltransferase with HDIG domain